MKFTTLLGLFLTGVSPLSFAAEPTKQITAYPDSNPLSAYLPTSDYSLGYLKQMFGDVGGMIHSDTTGSLGGFMMGDLFRVFNSAMLVFAVIVLIYIVFTSTLRMAHEGEAMGLGSKEWSSPWIVIRAAIAMVMLVPQTGGYCLAQKIVMYIVLMGVAGANMMWSTAVDKMLSKEALEAMITSQQPMVNTTKFLTVVEAIYEQQVCRWALYGKKDNGKVRVYGPFLANHHRIPNASVQYDTAFFSVVNWGGKDQNSKTQEVPVTTLGNDMQDSVENPLCGGIWWTYPYTKPTKENYTAFDPTHPEPQVELEPDPELETQIANAVYLVYLRLEYGGKYFQDNPDNTCGLPPGGNTSEQNSIAKNYGCFVLAMVDYTQFANESARHIQYSNYTDRNPIVGEKDNITLGMAIEKLKEVIKNQGWANAGSYFYNIAELSSAQTLAMSSLTLNIMPASYAYYKKNTELVNDKQSASNVYLQQAYQNLNNYYRQSNGTMEATDAQAQQLKTERVLSHVQGTINYDFGDEELTGRSKTLFDILTLGMAGWVASWNHSLIAAVAGQAEHGASMSGLINPVLSLQELGRVQMEQAEDVWIKGLATIEAISLTSAGVSIIPFIGNMAQPIADGMIAMIQWLQSLMSPIALMMFSSGFLLSTWLPFLPYVLSIFCVFGWILAVVEMMIAAPVVALGVLSPEGHSLFGKGAAAVLLSLAMFLRPMLMIVGFIAAIIGVFIISSIVNAGFLHMVNAVFHNQLTFLTSAGVITMYTLIMTALYNKSFGMMTAISNNVLRWIGGYNASVDQGESQMLDGMKSGMEGLGNKGGESMSQLKDQKTAGGELTTGATRKVAGVGREAGEGALTKMKDISGDLS